jgi:P27 family predicted phage terminase small subunit
MEPMRQKGRKSSRASLSLVGNPRVVSTSSPDDPLPPPPHLGEPERQIWGEVVADWRGTKVSFRVLTSALEMHQRARECRETIESEGLTIVGRDGQSRSHPLCSVERDANAAFLRGLKSLGIKV